MSPMVRRSLACSLALLFLLATGSPVMASTTSMASTISVSSSMAIPSLSWEPERHPGPFITEEEARSILQGFVPIDLVRGRLETYLNDWSRNPTWEFHYVREQGTNYRSHWIGSVHAQTGKLTRLNLDQPQVLPLKEGPIQNPYPAEFAQIWARAKIRQLLPHQFAALREAPPGLAPQLVPSPWDRTTAYTFTWMPYIDEIPVLNSYVTLVLDKETLHTLYFDANLQDVSAAPIKPALTPDEALAVFQDFGLQLAYISSFDESWGQSNSYRPVWLAQQASFTVDPLTGQLRDEAGGPVDRADAPAPVPADASRALHPGPLPLAPDQALTFAAQVLDISAEQLTVHATSDPDGSYRIWSRDDSYYASLQIHPETGLIRSAYRPPATYRDEYPEPTEEEMAAARLAAIATVQRLYPSQLTHLRMPQASPYSPYDFFFQRYENGLPVQYEGVSIFIDPETLQWAHIYANWETKATFTSPNPAITKAVAEQIYFANRSAVLAYTTPAYFIPFFPGPAPNEAVTPAYILDARNVAGVDGISRQLLDHMFRPLHWRDQLAAAVAGHWAEQELHFAFQRGGYGLLAPNPSAPLTRLDAIRLLLVEFDYWNYPAVPEMPYVDVANGSPTYWLVQAGLQAGWIIPQGSAPEFAGDQPISRAEFAMMVARYLQLGELASSKLRTETNYQDIGHLPQEQRNAIAFLEALGIVRPASTFRPNDAVTQAEGAAILVRLLNRVWGHTR